MKVSEMQLGDVVRPKHSSFASFSACIVKRINPDSTVILFRPYGVTADFSCTAGVICYTGIEEYTPNSNQEFDLLERRTLK
jgi:hypothetical protein